MKKKKALVLIIVSSLVVVFFSTLALLYFVQRAKLERLIGYTDKTIAYYLCESGVSAAITAYFTHSCTQGVIELPLPYNKRSWYGKVLYPGYFAYDGFRMDTKMYYLSFTVSDARRTRVPLKEKIQDVLIKVCVKSPLNFKKRTYCMTAEANRSFPIFLHGKP